MGSLKKGDDEFHLKALLDPQSAVGATDMVYGLHGTDLIHWWAKGANGLVGAGKSLGLGCEILLLRSAHGLQALVTKDGKGVSGAELEIYVGGRTEPVAAKTDSRGKVEIASPGKGLLAIGAIITGARPGDYKGKPYEKKRDMVTLTVNLA
jgi:hypothetical protein